VEFVELKPGKSVEGLDIASFRSDKKAKSYFYLMAGVHGDEVEGVYVLQQMFNWLKSAESVDDQSIELDIPMIVIPTLNIDGYRSSTRTNSHGVDLNRNLPSKSWDSEPREEKYNPGSKALSEPENIYLNNLFKKFPPHLILSLHSWKPMINYNGDCKKVAEYLNKFNSYTICDDIEGHPTPGSLGDYAPETFQSPVITYELPVITDGPSLEEVWNENKEGLINLLKTDLILKQ
jgi:protein MpaA